MFQAKVEKGETLVHLTMDEHTFNVILTCVGHVSPAACALAAAASLRQLGDKTPHNVYSELKKVKL